MKAVISLGIFSTLLVLAMGNPLTKKLHWVPNESMDGKFMPAIFGDVFDFNQENSLNANPERIDFYLWTQNSEARQEIENTTASLDSSLWDKDAPVKLFAHGFTGNGATGPTEHIREAYIDHYPSNVNLILIDWWELAAAPWYDLAALGTKTVGHKAGHLLDFLVRNGYTTPDKIHFLGHSLGSHVAGYAGAKFQELSGGTKIGRITALDPAKPRFGDAPDENRIDPSDAAFVDAMHTNAGSLFAGDLGFLKPRGHVDLYPNKGRSQPGCGGSLELIGMCSHLRTVKLWAESVQTQAFKACRCDDDDYDGLYPFRTCDCATKGETIMGEWAERRSDEEFAIYFLETNANSPFAKP